jgi:ABC-type transport system involved in cytochrome c biogenesis permease subunit
MCGIIPVAHWPVSSVRSSASARGTETVAMPSATNPASQLHMCGYRVGEATVNAPRSLARST